VNAGVYLEIGHKPQKILNPITIHHNPVIIRHCMTSSVENKRLCLTDLYPNIGEWNLQCFDVKQVRKYPCTVSIIVLFLLDKPGAPDNLWSSCILVTALQTIVGNCTCERSTDASARVRSKDMNAHTPTNAYT
jgi:hypothetical protein